MGYREAQQLLISSCWSIPIAKQALQDTMCCSDSTSDASRHSFINENEVNRMFKMFANHCGVMDEDGICRFLSEIRLNPDDPVVLLICYKMGTTTQT